MSCGCRAGEGCLLLSECEGAGSCNRAWSSRLASYLRKFVCCNELPWTGLKWQVFVSHGSGVWQSEVGTPAWPGLVRICCHMSLPGACMGWGER